MLGKGLVLVLSTGDKTDQCSVFVDEGWIWSVVRLELEPNLQKSEVIVGA